MESSGKDKGGEGPYLAPDGQRGGFIVSIGDGLPATKPSSELFAFIQAETRVAVGKGASPLVSNGFEMTRGSSSSSRTGRTSVVSLDSPISQNMGRSAYMRSFEQQI